MANSLPKAISDTARTISSLLVDPSLVALFADPAWAGDRWLTDSYVIVKLTGEVAPVPADGLVNGLEDGTYKLTATKGLTPQPGIRAGMAESAAKYLARMLDGQPTAPVHPTDWVMASSGPIASGPGAADAALWQRVGDTSARSGSTRTCRVRGAGWTATAGCVSAIARMASSNLSTSRPSLAASVPTWTVGKRQPSAGSPVSQARWSGSSCPCARNGRTCLPASGHGRPWPANRASSLTNPRSLRPRVHYCPPTHPLNPGLHIRQS